MGTFDYSDAPVTVRSDITAAQQEAWQAIGQPGSWWTGAQRVAIAAEVRNAPNCKLCRARKEALSPYAIEGGHDSVTDLPAAAIDIIHRVITDPARLTRSWCESILDEGLSDAEYVEIAIVSVLTVAVDTFARAIGSLPWGLPEAVDGEPTRIRPEGLADEGAYVPTIPSGGAGPAEADLYNPFGANIYRSISLVPDQARLFYAILRAQYLPSQDVANPESNGGRAISRPQMELIAARVSALNGCFYWTTAHVSMLRASGKHSGDDYDLTAVIGQSDDGDVADGATLIEFSEAVLDDDEARLIAARAAVRQALGEPGFVDTAAVVSLFDAIDRVADSTGMPLSDEILERSADVREALGLNDFYSVVGQ